MVLYNICEVAVCWYLVLIVSALFVGIILIFTDGWKFKFFFALYDFWGGMYWDRKREIIYVNPLPTMVFSFASDQNVWDEKEERWK